MLPNKQQLSTIRFSPDGNILAAGSFEALVRRWDFASSDFAELPALKGHDGWVQAIAFHGDGKRLFSADTWGRICAWPYREKEPKALWSVPDAHDGWVHALALSPDGTKLASCGRDRMVRIASTQDGKKEAALSHPDDILAAAFHPRGHLVTGDLMGVIREWDLKSDKPVREFDARILHLKDRIQDVGGVRCFCFDASGSLLLAGGSQPKSGGFVTGTNMVLAFDWQTGKLKHTFKGSADNEVYVLDMAMHPDGFLMAVSSGQPGNGRLFFLRLEDAAPFVSLPIPNCHSLARHPDGARLVVSATNGDSAGNGRQIDKNKDYPGHFSPLHVLDFPKSKS